MAPFAFKQRDYVGAFCEADEARAFRAACELEGRTVSSALRLAMRRFVDDVATTASWKDERPAGRPADVEAPTGMESEHVGT